MPRPLMAISRAALARAFGSHRDLDGLTIEVWDKIIAVNLTGPMRLIKAVAPVMKAQGRGRIVNISSVAGVGPTGSSIAYAVSKAGLIHLTRCMAVAWRPRCWSTVWRRACSRARGRPRTTNPSERLFANGHLRQDRHRNRRCFRHRPGHCDRARRGWCERGHGGYPKRRGRAGGSWSLDPWMIPPIFKRHLVSPGARQPFGFPPGGCSRCQIRGLPQPRGIRRATEFRLFFRRFPEGNWSGNSRVRARSTIRSAVR